MPEKSRNHNSRKPNYTARRIGAAAGLVGIGAAAALGVGIKQSVDRHNSAPACAVPVAPGEAIIDISNELNDNGADLDNRWTNDEGKMKVYTGKPGNSGVRQRDALKYPGDARLDAVAQGMGAAAGDYVGYPHVPENACRAVGGVVLNQLPRQ